MGNANLHIAIKAGSSNLVIPNATVRLQGIYFIDGSPIAIPYDATASSGNDGVADFEVGTVIPGPGRFLATVTTPKGNRAQADISGVFATDPLTLAPSVSISVPGAESEGSQWASVLAWWTGLGLFGQVAVVGGATLATILVAWGVSRALKARREREASK